MQDSNESSNKHSQQKESAQQQQPHNTKQNQQNKFPSWIPAAILILAFIGIFDAGYLTFEHITGGTPNCSILEGCDVVTTSKYSEILGIPVAGLGLAYYISMAGLMVAWFDRKKTPLLRLAGLFSWSGLLASAWFVWVQLGILGAICIYCMGSAVTSSLIFILGQILLKHLKK